MWHLSSLWPSRDIPSTLEVLSGGTLGPGAVPSGHRGREHWSTGQRHLSAPSLTDTALLQGNFKSVGANFHQCRAVSSTASGKLFLAHLLGFVCVSSDHVGSSLRLLLQGGRVYPLYPFPSGSQSTEMHWVLISCSTADLGEGQEGRGRLPGSCELCEMRSRHRLL